MTIRDLLHHTLTKGVEADPFISLSTAANLLPGERMGKSVSVSSI
jgi:hypothetical protein